LELQNVFDATGRLYYSGRNEDGTPNNNPITPLPNGIDISGLQAAIMVYNHHMEMIRDLTGINSAVDASSPSSESLVGVNKIAAQGTANTLRSTKNAYLNILNRTAKYVAMMIQNVCRYGDGVKGMTPAIGGQPAKIIEIGADVSFADIGIKIEALPTDEEKFEAYKSVDLAVQNQMIKPSDALFCKSINNIKQMRLYLAYKEKKYAEEKMAMAQSNAQQNAQANAQAGMAVEQAKAQTIGAKGAQEAQVLTIKSELDEQKAQKDFERQLQLEAVKHQYEMEQLDKIGQNDTANKKFQPSDYVK
jgi:hypothetical protein